MRMTTVAVTLILACAGAALAQDIQFGDDSSDWSNDGECDDPRFTGIGMADILLNENILSDASDCRTLADLDAIRLKSAAAETDSVQFGNDASTWANDGECDDPRFTGEGMATILLNGDIKADASDCRALYQSGSITLR